MQTCPCCLTDPTATLPFIVPAVGSQLKAMHLSVEAVGNQLGAAQALLAVFPRALCRLVRSISSAAELPIPTTSLGMFSQLTSLESITLAGADLLALQGAAGTLQRLVVHYPARVQSVAGLPALANLRYLNLCVTPAPPHALQVPELYSLSNLQTLEIVCPAPGLDFTADLSSFACLTKLVAGDIALGGQFVFEHLTALKSLQMTCPTLAALPPHISRLTNLTSLRLTCPTLDTIPPHIKVLTNLTTLNVYADFDLSNNFDIDNLPRSLPTRIFRQEPWPHCRLVAGPAVVIA